MSTNRRARYSRWDQPSTSHQTLRNSQSENRLPNKKPRSESTKVSIPPSPSSSASYSPPPVMPPREPKAMLRDRAKSQATISEAVQEMGDASDSGTSSRVAPWNHDYIKLPSSSSNNSDYCGEDEGPDGEEEQQRPLATSGWCNNFGCRERSHTIEDCPLPIRCWGCRSANHVWTKCPMTCVKCRHPCHKSDYCNDFQVWKDGDGLPYPRELWEMIKKTSITSEPPSKEPKQARPLYDAPKPAKKRSRELGSDVQLEDESSPRPKKRLADSAAVGADQYRPDSYERSEEGSVGNLGGRGGMIDSWPPHRMMDSYRPSEPPRGKIYCDHWLKTGDCRYMMTGGSCRYKHEIPDERILRGLGFSKAHPNAIPEKRGSQRIPLTKQPPTGPSSQHTVQGRQDLHNRPGLLTPPRTSSNSRLASSQPGQGPSSSPEGPKLGSRSTLKPGYDMTSASRATAQLMPKSTPSPFLRSVPESAYSKTPSHTSFSLPVFKPAPRSALQPAFHNMLPVSTQSTPSSTLKPAIGPTLVPASTDTHASNASETAQSSKSDAWKAFEEEELIAQKRHEAKMRRMAEEMQVENESRKAQLEYESKMAKLRGK